MKDFGTRFQGGKARREGDGGLEAAVAVAQQHAHVAAVAIGGGKVGDSVAVEVGHRDGEGLIARRVVDGGLEGAVAVAQQHAHV